MNNEVMVSICCIAYNQKEYIAQAIESFLMQRTNFNYEILIHDDASNDGTADIIKEYEKKYPCIIKVIYQTENQYSKGVRRIDYMYNYNRAKGKYIAICEGDDYWTDMYKLQKQVDYMEENPMCTLCTHAVQKINVKTGKDLGLVRPYDLNKVVSMEDIIVGGGGFVGTNSLLFPRKLVKEFPKWYFNSYVGDYPLQIFLTSKGYTYYMDQNMSVYRYNSINSWTSSMLKSGRSVWIDLYKNLNDMMHEINIDTDYKYSECIEKIMKQNNFNILLLQSDINKLRQAEYIELYNQLDKKVKFISIIKHYFPLVEKICVYVKKNIR